MRETLRRQTEGGQTLETGWLSQKQLVCNCCWCHWWPTMMPRALRMLSLHMGQVQCSFSQGSTHILWKTCLQRHRDISHVRTIMKKIKLTAWSTSSDSVCHVVHHVETETSEVDQSVSNWSDCSYWLSGIYMEQGDWTLLMLWDSLAGQDANHIVQLVGFNTHRTVVKVWISFLKHMETLVKTCEHQLTHVITREHL